jgi:hypothetical protein
MALIEGINIMNQAISIQHRPKRDVVPLVIFSGLGFILLLLIIVPAEDMLAMLANLLLVTFLAGRLYTKGIKSIDSEFPASLFWLAFVLKLISSAVNYWFVAEYYGQGDANRYYIYGLYVAEHFAVFDFSVLETFFYASQGTSNMIFMTGLMLTVLPASLSGTFFLFATLAFTGSVFFYRASRLAFPESNPNWFRFGIFFLPSVLYWPAGPGKDAWIFFLSGLVAYGLAKYFRQGRLSGLLLVALGLFLINLVRPHISLFLGLAIGGAFLVYLFGAKTTLRRPEAIFIGGVLVMGFVYFALQSGFAFIGIEDFAQEEVETFYSTVQGRFSDAKGSNFQPASVFNPVGAVQGIITVLFRPFPWEAHNLPALVTSIETLMLGGILWLRRRTLWARISSFRTDPWLAFLAIYALVMILGLTILSNFGLLARQRVMVLPFLWMLFA